MQQQPSVGLTAGLPQDVEQTAALPGVEHFVGQPNAELTAGPDVALTAVRGAELTAVPDAELTVEQPSAGLTVEWQHTVVPGAAVLVVAAALIDAAVLTAGLQFVDHCS